MEAVKALFLLELVVEKTTGKICTEERERAYWVKGSDRNGFAKDKEVESGVVAGRTTFRFGKGSEIAWSLHSQSY